MENSHIHDRTEPVAMTDMTINLNFDLSSFGGTEQTFALQQVSVPVFHAVRFLPELWKNIRFRDILKGSLAVVGRNPTLDCDSIFFGKKCCMIVI